MSSPYFRKSRAPRTLLLVVFSTMLATILVAFGFAWRAEIRAREAEHRRLYPPAGRPVIREAPVECPTCGCPCPGHGDDDK